MSVIRCGGRFLETEILGAFGGNGSRVIRRRFWLTHGNQGLAIKTGNGRRLAGIGSGFPPDSSHHRSSNGNARGQRFALEQVRIKINRSPINRSRDRSNDHKLKRSRNSEFRIRAYASAALQPMTPPPTITTSACSVICRASPAVSTSRVPVGPRDQQALDGQPDPQRRRHHPSPEQQQYPQHDLGDATEVDELKVVIGASSAPPLCPCSPSSPAARLPNHGP